MKYVFTIALSVLSLASCSSVKQSAKALSENTWQLVGIQGFVMEKTMETPTLTFNTVENRVSGNTGCNGFGGEYALNAKAISFKKLISTERGCAEGMDTESKFMSALRNVNGYIVKTESLLLTQDGKTVLEFKKK